MLDFPLVIPYFFLSVCDLSQNSTFSSGGIGGGCIGIGYKGDFRRWSLYPGKYVHKIVLPNQFSIRIKRRGVTQSKVLSTFDKPQNSDLSTWNWSIPKSKVSYYALNPRSWTEIKEPVPQVNIVIEQMSPIIPHNYSDTSLPVGVFRIYVENTSEEEIEASVMFSFQNGIGVDADDAQEDRIHHAFVIQGKKCNEHSPEQSSSAVRGNQTGGVMMTHPHSRQCVALPETGRSRSSWCPPQRDSSIYHTAPSTKDKLHRDPGSFSIAAALQDSDGHDVRASCCPMFVASNGRSVTDTSLPTAEDLWRTFSDKGSLSQPFHQDSEQHHSNVGTSEEQRNGAISSQNIAPSNYTVGAAVCACQRVAAGRCVALDFSLGWDNPVARFGSGSAVFRRHTRFFGRSGLSSPSLCAFALMHRDRWKRQICRWQEPVLADTELPSFYRHMLFNELYYLADGGTVWGESEDEGNLVGEVSSPGKGDVAAMDTSFECDETLLIGPSPKAKRAGDTEGSGGYVSHVVQALRSQRVLDEGIYDAMQREDEALNELLKAVGPSVERTGGARRVSGLGLGSVGRFLYLEGHEYLMYNTYDVHHYAGFALLSLWPLLELSLQKDFAVAVGAEDLTRRRMMGSGDVRPRKVSTRRGGREGEPSPLIVSDAKFFVPMAVTCKRISSGWRGGGT